MSIFKVFVVLVNIINILTPMIIGIKIAATGEAQAPAAADGHPVSSTVNFNPNLSTICCAAGPRLPVSKLITKFMPTNPIPIVKPAFNAFFNPIPKTNPIIRIAIGKITVGPRPRTYCITPLNYS